MNKVKKLLYSLAATKVQGSGLRKTILKSTIEALKFYRNKLKNYFLAESRHTSDFEPTCIAQVAKTSHSTKLRTE